MKANLLFTYTILLILFTSCHSEKAVVTETKKQPNILFLFADDQRFNTINALGNKEVITPNLDQLVNTGTSFTNAYIFGAMNGAVCAPSRGMLMTGRSIFQLNPIRLASAMVRITSMR